jgi:hypothetical protein
MRQPAHNGSVLRQSQTAICAQIRGAAGMRVGDGAPLRYPMVTSRSRRNRSANREDIGSAATNATWRSDRRFFLFADRLTGNSWLLTRLWFVS